MLRQDTGPEWQLKMIQDYNKIDLSQGTQGLKWNTEDMVDHFVTQPDLNVFKYIYLFI